MANSKYEYVRSFEREETLLPNTWIVVRIDGRGFHKLSTHYAFTKPNDSRALSLMNAAATKTLTVIPSLILAYGVSDEYSFVFSRATVLFERRRDKLVSTVVSTFTAAYVRLWGEFFHGSASGVDDEEEVNRDKVAEAGSMVDADDSGVVEGAVARSRVNGDGKATGQEVIDISMLPTFDARAITYPTTANLRDYLSWRQVDCHINNLYNTTFWALVQRMPLPSSSSSSSLASKPTSDDNDSANNNNNTTTTTTSVNNANSQNTLQTKPLSHTAAETLLKGTLSADKHELLFSRFGINYNNECEMFRKGSVVYRHYHPQQQCHSSEYHHHHHHHHRHHQETPLSLSPSAARNGSATTTEEMTKAVLSKTQIDKRRKARMKAEIVVEHCDIIKDEFWDRRPWLLGGGGGAGGKGDLEG